jgi:uncharacterized protein YecE (DUF72 family)
MLSTDNPYVPPLGVHLGCAGWNIRREHTERFPAVGTHLERYAAHLNAVEINSCFYRPHRFATYERWAASVPESFRFSVKLPKLITHEARLVGVAPALERFLRETSGLGVKRGPVLVQLPPSFAFDPRIAATFFIQLRDYFEGDVVFEPRHETWFTNEVDSMLCELRVARVAADPAPVPAAAGPSGYDRLLYLRLHGSPRIYYSAYSSQALDNIGRFLDEKSAQGIVTWCIFDNTALGSATADALTVKSHLLGSQRVAR